MAETDLSLTFDTPECTAAFARHLAPKLQPGDVILLEGDVGAGKTHFARSLIQSLLDIHEDVPSPTFTLVQTYDVPSGDLWHADLYRLTSDQEIEELGLIDAFETAICLVEWPDRLGDLRPKDALTLNLHQVGTADQRQAHLSSADDRWQVLLQDQETA